MRKSKFSESQVVGILKEADECMAYLLDDGWDTPGALPFR